MVGSAFNPDGSRNSKSGLVAWGSDAGRVRDVHFVSITVCLRAHPECTDLSQGKPNPGEQRTFYRDRRGMRIAIDPPEITRRVYLGPDARPCRPANQKGYFGADLGASGLS